jgi:hypothetical protein
VDYSASNVGQPASEEEVMSEINRWDAPGANWDTGFWDGRLLTPTDHRIGNSGENISFIIRKVSDYQKPLKITGIHFRYLLRRLKR